MGKEAIPPLSLSLLSHFCRASPQHGVSPACSSLRHLSPDGTRRPGGTSSSLTAFSKAKFILNLCLRKGPGSWTPRGHQAPGGAREEMKQTLKA